MTIAPKASVATIERTPVAAAIDLHALARAVRRSVGHDGMRKEDAEAIAAHILNFFGFNERIIDNVLEPDDRDTFYMLEDCGILETERDETTLYDGREWRIHYWMFRKDRILQLAQEEAEETGELPTFPRPTLNATVATIPMPAHVGPNVYHELADDIWSQREGEGEAESTPLLPVTPSGGGRGRGHHPA